MNTYGLPLICGVAIDKEKTRRFDDIFWVHKNNNEYLLRVCVPSMSYRDTRVSPGYEQGFLLNQRIPAICFEFDIKSFHHTFGLRSFRMYECWGESIANLTDQHDVKTLPQEVKSMLEHTQVFVLTLKYFFQKSGAFSYKDRMKVLPELSNTHFLMTFVNMIVGNLGVMHKIPLLYYDLEKEKVFEVNAGAMIKLLPYYAHVTSPLRRIPDIINQCNLMAFFKNLPYPMDTDDLASFEFDDGYSHYPVVFQPQKRKQPETPVIAVTPIEIVKVVGGDYVKALDATYAKAKKSAPVYTYHKLSKKLVECLIMAEGFFDPLPFSLNGTGSGKKEAALAAAKNVYCHLSKRYQQKKAV